MLGFVRRLLGIAPPAAEVPAVQWQRVERTLPFLDHLPANDRVRLRELALEFLRRKEFHGAQGLALDDDMLLAIALQACLPILNIGLQRGIIEPALFTIMVLMAVVTTLMATPIFERIYGKKELRVT